MKSFLRDNPTIARTRIQGQTDLTPISRTLS